MKKFKILHIPTALYVWEYPEYIYKGLTCVDDSDGKDSIFLCGGKNILKYYLSNQIGMKVAGDGSSIIFYDTPVSPPDPVILHEFEIVEVTDEDV